MKALVFERKMAKFAAARVAATLAGSGRGASVGPLRLADIDEPLIDAPGWVRVRPRLAGICGSDLATIDATSSRYFEPIVSFPFVPGHEIVGELDDGTRVVVMSTLSCAARGIDPLCDQCEHGATNLCERTAFGHLQPGLQTGFCEDTGGGWGVAMMAHDSQLLAIPDDLTDEQAVMVEPAACAIHAVERALEAVGGTGVVGVIGAGTLGLLTLAALNRPSAGSSVRDGAAGGALGHQSDGIRAKHVVITAKYPDQRRWAKDLGADLVVEPDALARAIRSHTTAFEIDGQLTTGADTVFDCVGSAASITQALNVTAPGGEIVLVGMPGVTTVDLTSLWHREVSLRGSYAYTKADFEAAVELVRHLDLGRLVSATYPLDRYTDAIQHAADAGRRGAVKVAFDLRNERGR